MPRRTVRATVTFCATASLAALMGASPATPAASPPSSHSAQQLPGQVRQPVIVDCFWQPHIRPADFLLACGDGNSRLASLRWSYWGPNSAMATGINVVNDCKPYCAKGTFHAYQVTVWLDNPRPWKKDPQLPHYTRMSLVYTDLRPAGYERTANYPLWN